MTRWSFKQLTQNLFSKRDTTLYQPIGPRVSVVQDGPNKPSEAVVVTTDAFELEKSSSEESQVNPRRRWYSGWRVGTLLSSVVVIISLAINIAVAAWLSKNATFEDGLAELYHGDCSKVRHINLLVHIVVNTLSTMMLSGSNYTMQVLVAPTREEVDKVHRRGGWLDIGVPSVRNLFAIAPTRVALWIVLALSSLPLHLVFNSVFYASFSTNDYNVFVVSPTFIEGATFYPPNVTITQTTPWVNVTSLQTAANTSTLERLENADCIGAYATETLDQRRNLLIVSSHIDKDNSLLNGTTYSFSDNLEQGSDPYAWLCNDPGVQARIAWDRSSDVNYEYPGCQPYMAGLQANASTWTPLGFKADYCLSERVEGRCTFNVNQKLIFPVIAVNVTKAVVMICVALLLRNDRILVMGDAIESFLTQPDEMTKNMCLLTWKDIRNEIKSIHGPRLPQIQKIQEKASAGRPAKFQRIRWFFASSTVRRATTWATFMYYPLMIIVVFGIAKGNVTNSSWSGIKALGFGRVSATATFQGSSWAPTRIGNPADRLIANTLLANTPQVLLSLVYVVGNGYLTAMFAADEWSDFAVHRKTLRVSTPKGSQRSTYFLQLPYKIALPLMIITTTSHWLMSQSIFLVVISEWSAKGVLLDKTALGTCGFSLLPMIVGAVVSVITGLALGSLGFRTYNSCIPLVGSCSFAIAASCHAPAWEESPALLPLKWGVVTVDGWGPFTTRNEHGQEVGHCSFSSGEVETPVVGQLYAGMHPKND